VMPLGEVSLASESGVLSFQTFNVVYLGYCLQALSTIMITSKKGSWKRADELFAEDPRPLETPFVPQRHRQPDFEAKPGNNNDAVVIYEPPPTSNAHFNPAEIQAALSQAYPGAAIRCEHDGSLGSGSAVYSVALPT
jgi:hypothetical protein